MNTALKIALVGLALSAFASGAFAQASAAVTTMPSMYSSEFHVYRNELFEGEDDDDGVTEGSFFDD